MGPFESAWAYLSERECECLDQLKEFLAIPSISTLPQHKADVRRAAEWLVDALRQAGIARVEIVATPGHPIVYAESEQKDGRPTVLVYGHYDVQPVDPVGEWDTPPFEPTERGDKLYARGGADMKGAIVAQIKAVEALHRSGGLPVNLKYVLEGEEEIGSPNLEPFIEGWKKRLACDVVLNCDGGMLAPDLPAIVYALRGLAYFEVEVRGPAQDLHSGVFGGAVQNPANVLCKLIAGMHDDDLRVTLPGFYDKVRELDAEEREALSRTPLTDAKVLKATGAPALDGEAGYSVVERMGARPTLDVNGIIGGFTGEGAKTVLPAKALAKISMRLVADQDHTAIAGQLRAYLEANAPKTVTWDVRDLNSGPGAIMDRNSPYMQAAKEALLETFGIEPVLRREGGSVPVVGIMQDTLGVDSVVVGLTMPDSGIHAPNEHLHVPTFHKGAAFYARYLVELGV